MQGMLGNGRTQWAVDDQFTMPFGLMNSGPTRFCVCIFLYMFCLSGKIILSAHLFFGYALHEKGLQGQKGDGPLVSSQEQSVDSVTRGVRSERVLEVRVVARHAQEQVL